MRDDHDNFDLILVLVIGILSIVIIFVYFWVNNILTYSTLPLAILLFVSMLGISFFAYDVSMKLIENDGQILFQRYLIFNFFESKNDLCDFEKYCVSEHKKEAVNWLRINFWGTPEEDIFTLLEKNDISSLEKLLLSKSKKKRLDKHALKCIYLYSAPKFYYLFIQYKNGTLLNEKKPIIELVLSVISFILSLFSIFGFSSLLDIHWIIYATFAAPMLVSIINSIATYKSLVLNLRNYYSTMLEDLEKTYTQFVIHNK